jgi:hypothetical protein
MTKFSKKAAKEAERLGYVYSHANSSNFDVYVHPTAGEVSISVSLNDENLCLSIIRQMQKSVRMLDRAKGRSTAAIKDRNARQAELDAKRLAAERRDIEMQHTAFLARIGGAVLTQVDRADLALIESRIAEIRRLELLMTAVPASAAHRGTGQPRHQAGAR